MSTFIDSLTAIQTAVRDGEKWEYKHPSSDWMTPIDQSVDWLNGLVEDGCEVRLVPEPPKPQTRDWNSADDLPGPICWLADEEPYHLRRALVTGVGIIGLTVNDGLQIDWKDIGKWHYSTTCRPDDFHPCTCAVE